MESVVNVQIDGSKKSLPSDRRCACHCGGEVEHSVPMGAGNNHCPCLELLMEC